MVVTVPVNYILNKYVLSAGALSLGERYAAIDLSFLSLIVFIAVVASIVQIVGDGGRKFAPALYGQLGIFLPLIAVNCAIPWRLAIHAGARLSQRRRGCHFRTRLGYRLVARHCRNGRSARENHILARTRSLARRRHNLYPDRAHGPSVHVFSWVFSYKFALAVGGYFRLQQIAKKSNR